MKCKPIINFITNHFLPKNWQLLRFKKKRKLLYIRFAEVKPSYRTIAVFCKSIIHIPYPMYEMYLYQIPFPDIVKYNVHPKVFFW